MGAAPTPRVVCPPSTDALACLRVNVVDTSTASHRLQPLPLDAAPAARSLDDRYARLAATRALSGRTQQAALALLLQLARGSGGGGGGDAALSAIATYQPPRLLKPAVRTLAQRPATAVVWRGSVHTAGRHACRR